MTAWRRWVVTGTMLVLIVAAACSAPVSEPAAGPVRDSRGSTGAPSTRPLDHRGEGVASPVVRGPLTGGERGTPFNAMPADLRERFSYVEEEYLVAGTASAYTEQGEWGTDGRWTVQPSVTAGFTTRILVRRPAEPSASDGVAVVEWLNVSSGQDADAEFAQTHDELLAHGTTWVGVSAQAVGIQGGGPTIGFPGLAATPLKTWDPQRYADLAHPGDDFSYDIFSQAAAGLRRPVGVDPLAGLPITHLLAAGESQSAARLVTYINAVHPRAGIYDGFFVHSRSMGGSVLHADPVPQPPFAWIRGDLDVPVFQFQTESDIVGLPFLPARQPDTDRLRTWEVAGTSHLDRAVLTYLGRSAPPGTPSPVDALAALCGPINDGPQAAVASTAMAALRSWVVDGDAPPSAEPIAVAADQVERDGHGVARGGLRTPPVDAPVAALRGDNAQGGYVCGLVGSTAPFAAATLAELYPSHDAYVDAVRRSAEAAVTAGHLRPVDADRFVAEAQQSAVGG